MPRVNGKLAGLAELVVEIEIVEVCVRVERVDGNSTDRRVGRMLFQETTCHSVRLNIRIIGLGKTRLLPKQQIIRSGTIIGSAG